jgi:SfnB family sulfur acquisition oxidoreductase
MAHIIQTDQEAIDIAQQLAKEFAADSTERDRERLLPYKEIERLSESGLLGITVPKEYGGADVAHVTIAEVFRLLSVGDASLGQIPQNHFCFVDPIRDIGTLSQQQFFFTRFLKGERLGNALSERGGKHVFDLHTTLIRQPDGSYEINGKKFYCTGALFAHWIPVFAINEEEKLCIAYVPRDTQGVEVIDDWTGMGQRTTASGTTVLNHVRIPAEYVIPYYKVFENPQIRGAFGQIMHVAINVGIADAALADTREFVKTHSRVWFDAGVEKASDDPFIIRRFGELQIKANAARALLQIAGETLDYAKVNLNEETAAAASVAVAEAKQFAEWTALEVTNELFSLSGTKATLSEFNLDRHWRNARTHTLHDPTRWKTYAVGNYHLNDIKPKNHGLI